MEPKTAKPHRLLARGGTLDAIDHEVISHLQEDGRRSLVVIAQALGLTERVVRQRVHHLLETGIVQIVALTSPKAMGYNAAALLGLETDPAVPASQIAAALAELEEIDYVVNTTGRFRLFAEIITTDRKRLLHVIEHDLAALRGIMRVEIFPYYSVYFQKVKFFAPHDTPIQGGVRDELLDSVDASIAEVLSENARQPLRLVSEKLGISETQIRTRLTAMQQEGRLNITAIINPLNLEGYTMAWVAVRVAQGSSIAAVADILTREPQVTYVAICGGRFDIFAELACPPSMPLLKAVDESIRTLSGVERVESFVYLDLHYKRISPTRGRPQGI